MAASLSETGAGARIPEAREGDNLTGTPNLTDTLYADL